MTSRIWLYFCVSTVAACTSCRHHCSLMHKVRNVKSTCKIFRAKFYLVLFFLETDALHVCHEQTRKSSFNRGNQEVHKRVCRPQYASCCLRCARVVVLHCVWLVSCWMHRHLTNFLFHSTFASSLVCDVKTSILLTSALNRTFLVFRGVAFRFCWRFLCQCGIRNGLKHGMWEKIGCVSCYAYFRKQPRNRRE